MSAEGKLDWLTGGGEMARTIMDVDWSATPLGPLETWPPSLRTTVSLCLGSNFPINIIWGEAHSQIYNDGYRVVCGAVHPRAMGEDYRVTWASAWPAIGAPFERALTGETSYLENQRMFLERNGYHEETFFTFSLSPIRDESGKVVGLFHPVSETTATMLGERRTRALRDIADGAGNAAVFDEACRLLLETTKQHAFDVPFALLYVVIDGRPVLQGARGGAPSDVAGWPLAEAAKAGKVLRVDALAERFGDIPSEIYPEPVTTAFVLPLRIGGAGVEPFGFLVVGASPRLPLDPGYEGYFEMLGAAATAALGNARAYEAEKKRAEALAELDRTKTAFFSNVSHEFRTPLTLLLGPIEDLLGGRHGALPEEARGELAVVRRNALRLLKLVNSLLDFSRAEAGRAEASFRATDLSTFTRAVASMFVSAVERAGLRLVIDVDPIEELVLVDRDMWEKIVLNLLSNAFKFTHQGEIRVTLRRVDGSIELAVRDTGIGIAPSELGRVFERFHRVQGAPGRTHEGSGIGLSLVDDLVKLHGGSTRVESEPGSGSTFTVRIPACHPADSLAVPVDQARSKTSEAFVEEALRWLPDAATPPSADTKAVPSDGRARVLLVDDNADMRDYVRGLLAPRYHVTAVRNGEEALVELRAHRSDLVLSDLMMPVMDGAELVAALRADEDLRTIPIILLSARAGDEAKSSGIELGADDYLTKPFSARELLARVHSQLTMAALRLETANQAALLAQRDEFLAIASHELKTPLTTLRMQLQLAETSVQRADAANQDEKLPRRIVVASRQVDRLAALVDDLLDVARIRSSTLELARERIDLVLLVHDALERLSAAIEKAGNTMRVIAPSELRGSWDARRLEQVLVNVVSNALKYAPGTPIELRVSTADDGAATIAVCDSGPGVAEDQRATIFDRFDRGRASRNSGGLGLGLFISQAIVRAHGGSMDVERASGGGACFSIRLPRELGRNGVSST